MKLIGVDAGASCMDPVTFERWSGEQLHLVSMDPDWPGHPERPEGDGWIWVASVADIMRRFCGLLPLGSGQKTWQTSVVDIEIVAAANDELRYEAIAEPLYSYGFHFGWGNMVHGYRSPGVGVGYDIEGRGGAWVRRIAEPPPWVFGEPDDEPLDD